MEIFLICLILLSIASAAILGVVLFNYAISWYRKRKIINESMNNTLIKKENFIYWMLRNGVTIFNKPSSFLLSKVSVIDKVVNNYVVLLNDKSIQCSNTSILSSFIFFILFLGVFASIVFTSPIAGISLILCICVLSVTISRALIDKRVSNLRNSIPDTLRTMNTCFGAGYTIFQTFLHLGSESKGLIKSVFSNCTNIIRTGGSVQDSLDSLKKIPEVPELSFLSVALDVQHQTGGSIRPVIDSAKDMVENKLELMRMLQVQTAQAKLSARIVMVLPFALISIFSIISPGFLVPFFSSFIGFLILLVAIVMQAAGIILVKKTLNVEI